MKIIKRPVFTEKAINLNEQYNQYVFDVNFQLTKPEICRLVEKIFCAKVVAINTYLPPCNKRQRGRLKGFIPKIKRVFVTLARREKIVFFSESLLIFIYVFEFCLFFEPRQSSCYFGLVSRD